MDRTLKSSDSRNVTPRAFGIPLGTVIRPGESYDNGGNTITCETLGLEYVKRSHQNEELECLSPLGDRPEEVQWSYEVEPSWPGRVTYVGFPVVGAIVPDGTMTIRRQSGDAETVKMIALGHMYWHANSSEKSDPIVRIEFKTMNLRCIGFAR